MSSMVERVARVLQELRSPLVHWSHYEQDARAVIAAMREPTGEMLIAGEREGDIRLYRGHQLSPHIWQAMIDAALEGK